MQKFAAEFAAAAEESKTENQSLREEVFKKKPFKLIRCKILGLSEAITKASF